MRTKLFFGFLSVFCFGLFAQSASAQATSKQAVAPAWIGDYEIMIYVDQQNPALLHLETTSGRTFNSNINVTIDYEVKPAPGQPTDSHGKIIRYFTVTLPAGRNSAAQQCNDILYYPCHNGLPVVTGAGGEQISAGFDESKYFPTFGMEFYPDYQ